MAAATIGSASNATPASVTLVASSMPVTPRRVDRAMMPWATPVCRNDDRASMSVVIRVMMRPDR